MAQRAGLNMNLMIAAVVTVAVAVWLLSGWLWRPAEEETEPQASEERPLPEVAVRAYSPQPFTRTLQIVGDTEADVVVNLAAQTPGQVDTVQVQEGDIVGRRDVLMTLDRGIRDTDYKAAKADLRAKQLELDAAQKLHDEGFLSETGLAERQAAYEAALAQAGDIAEDLDDTTIRLPLSAQGNYAVETLHVEVGDYVARGEPVAQLVGQQVQLLVAQASQQERDLLQRGQQAGATLANGQQISGTVRMVAQQADPHTRTYRVEVVAEAADKSLPAGMTATVAFPVGDTDAYFIPHDAMVLKDDGDVGVMAVTEEQTARFLPATFLQDTTKGAWVTLASKAPSITLVVRGQADLKDGTKIKPVMAKTDD